MQRLKRIAIPMVGARGTMQSFTGAQRAKIAATASFRHTEK